MKKDAGDKLLIIQDEFAFQAFVPPFLSTW